MATAAPGLAVYCPSTGQAKICTLCVDFSDAQATGSVESIQAWLYGDPPPSGGSLHDYYDVNSYGALDINGEALGWYRMPEPWSHYIIEEGPYHTFEVSELFGAAIAAADADGVDFSDFDGNSDGYVDALFLIIGGSADPGRRSAVTLDIQVDGVHITNATFGDEDDGWQLFAHELGHLMSLSDFYDEYWPAARPHFGNWSMMGTGANAGVNMDAFCKIQMGWVTPTVPTQNLSSVTIPPAGTDPVVYKLASNGIASGEYFLVENRQKTGYDQGLPGSGLVVYHVVSDVPPYAIHIEEADGNADLVLDGGAGQSSDSWPGTLGRTVFNSSSTPNSDLSNGHETLVGLSSIAVDGLNITADIQVTIPPNTVRVNGKDVSPDAFVLPGATVPVEELCFNTNGGSVLVTGLTIQNSGSCGDELDSILVYADTDADGVVDSGESLLATVAGTGGTAQLSFSVSGAEESHLLLVCEGSEMADLGDQFGIRIASSSDVQVESGKSVDSAGFPIESELVTVASVTNEAGWPLMTYQGTTVLLADLDCDGVQDIVYSARSGVDCWTLRAKNSQMEDLPGWVQIGTFCDGSVSQLAAGDLNGDARPEVVAATSEGSIYAWTHYGRAVAGWPQHLPLSGLCTGLVLADLDGDGVDEILVGSDQGAMVAYRADGKLLWQADTDSTSPGVAVVGDIEGNGTMSVIACAGSNVYAWDQDGALINTSWPVDLGGPCGIPILVDVDSDGALEAVVSWTFGITALKANATPPSGSDWPVSTGYGPTHGMAVGNVRDSDLPEIVLSKMSGIRTFALDGTEHQPISSASTLGAPSIVDLDDDGCGEILFTAPYDQVLHAKKANGLEPPGWPLPLGESSGGTAPSIADIDGDGYLEVLMSDESKINCWEIHESYTDDALMWPVFQQNARKSGVGPEMTGPGVMNAYHSDATHVQLWFTERLDPTTSEISTNYQLDNGATVSSAVAVERPDRTEVTLTTSSLTSDLTYTVTMSGITDLAGNPVAQDTCSFNTDALTLLGCCSSASGYADVLFSRPVNTQSGTYERDSNPLPWSSLLNFGNETVVSVQWLIPGNTLEVSDVVGLAGGAIDPDPSTVLVSSRPSVSLVLWVDDTHIDVVFSGEVDEDSALDAANYYINAGIDVLSASVFSQDPLTIRLTTDEQTPDTEYTLGATGVTNDLGITAIGSNALGSFVATPRPATWIDIEQQMIRLHADGTETMILSAILLDEYDRVAEAATNPVTFTLSEGASLCTFEGSNPATPTDGQVEITLRAGSVPGQVEVTAESTGLTSDTISGYVMAAVQNGWPVVVSDEKVYSSPAIADLDDDGVFEAIICTGEGQVLKVSADGTATEIADLGVPLNHAPAVGDLDADDAPEIVVSGPELLYALRADGSTMFTAGGNEATSPLTVPVLGDIDGDDLLEVVVGTMYGVCAFNSNGSVATGWPKSMTEKVECTPALGDIDGDDHLEVVAGDVSGAICVWNGDGSILSTWPTDPNFQDRLLRLGLGAYLAGPALVDLDNDGKTEIVLGTTKWGLGGHFIALNEDGSYVSGWPLNPATDILASPAIGDVDGNGAVDIVFVGMNGRVYSITASGALTSGWTVPDMGTVTPYDYSARQSSPILADFDGDSLLEVLVGCEDGKLYAFDSNGSLISGWPKATGGPIKSTPAVGNLDGDGLWEVVVGSNDGGLYRWEIGGNTAYNPADLFPWTTFHGNNERTGFFDHNFSTLATSVTVSDTWTHEDEEVTLSAVLKRTDCNAPLANKTLVFKVEGTTVGSSSTDESGVAEVNYTPTETGTFTVTVEFAGTGKYSASSDTGGLTSVTADVLQLTDGVTGCTTLADLDGDGQDETIVGSEDGVLHAFEADGSELSGWPKTLAGAINDAASVGDIDADGQLEVVAVGDGTAYAFESDGTLMSGWPTSHDDGVYYSSPALGDLNNDGTLEIVLGSGYMAVAAYEYDGTMLTGWPQNAGDPVYGTPALGDIDGDGTLEVVAGDSAGFLWVWEADGTPLETWPEFEYGLQLGAITSSPALANVNNDGKLEIVVTTHRYGGGGQSAVAVLDRYGQYLSGWPHLKNTGIQSSPAIGDIDCNGALDIVYVIDNGYVVSRSPAGSLTSGWYPVPNLGASVPQDYTYRSSSPVLADIDGDDALEVIVGSYDGKVHAFNNDATVLSGWPKTVTGPVRSTAAVGNMDGDGYWDIVAATDNGRVYRWEVAGDTSGKPANLFPWPTFHGDNQRSGNFRILGRDSFTRSLWDTWGTADLGGPWSSLNFLTGDPWNQTVCLYVSNDRACVEPGFGGMTAGTSLLTQRAIDMDATVELETADFGGTAALIVRASSYNTFYAVTWSVTDAECRLERYESGVRTVLDSEDVEQSSSQAVLRIKVEGDTIKAKHWGFGTNEPATWSLVATDTSPLPAGRAGVWMSNQEMLYLYDDFYAECLAR